MDLFGSYSGGRIYGVPIRAGKKYDTLEKINIYYDRIESISDWPFNPKSIKKLVITLGSSVVPLLLSFIGF